MEIPESDREGGLPHPRETLDLFGHEDAARAFAQAVVSGRMPSAWLIGGPRGVGKATLAYRMARVLLGNHEIDPAAPDPLHVSAGDKIARQVASLTHPDLLILRRPWDEKTKRFKQSLPVEEVRRIHGFFGRHASAGGWRVCIVDAADDLNANAANALLKTVEEPPRRSVFLIIAHAPARLLPTIRSRCRRLLLKPLDEAPVERLLSQRVPDLSADDRVALARLAEGRPGRALVLAAEGGLALYQDLSALLNAVPAPDPARLYALADRLARADAEQTYRTATELLNLWLTRLVRQGAERPGTEILAGEGAHMTTLRAGASLERWVEVWENFQHLVARADAVALDRRHVILSLFAALGRVATGGSAELLLERV